MRKRTRPKPVESIQATSIWDLNLWCGELDHFLIAIAASIFGRTHVAIINENKCTMTKSVVIHANIISNTGGYFTS